MILKWLKGLWSNLVGKSIEDIITRGAVPYCKFCGWSYEEKDVHTVWMQYNYHLDKAQKEAKSNRQTVYLRCLPCTCKKEKP
jgi:hypothetical protein